MKRLMLTFPCLLTLALACGPAGSTGSNGAGDTDGGASSTPNCDTYCTTIMAACTGANQQYTTMDNCLHSCAAMPVGAASDTSGNTLGCRSYHANAAKTNATLHCPHAGPGGAGVCGANCDGYCQIALKYCDGTNGANKIYTDAADCEATCAATPDDETYNVSTDSGPHVACLLYHVQEASTVPADHCNGDLDKTADTCK